MKLNVYEGEKDTLKYNPPDQCLSCFTIPQASGRSHIHQEIAGSIRIRDIAKLTWTFVLEDKISKRKLKIVPEPRQVRYTSITVEILQYNE